MVSTDDEEIAAISRKLGAGVPFMRSKKTSDEKTGIADVMAEVITDYESLGRSFDVFCCLLATAPFVSAEHLREGYRLLESEKFDSVLSATQYGHPIERALQIEGKKAVMKWPENYSRRSQDIPPSCHDAGQFYWMRTDALLRESRLFTDSTGAIILPATEVQDIDDDDDWKLAELKFEIIRKS
jgi:N-acylneuraminate cytidylyltransferase